MTATTYTHTHNDAAAKRGVAVGSWLARLFERMVESQSLRARRMVAQQLSTLSDSHLRDLGFADADIARLRMRRPA